MNTVPFNGRVGANESGGLAAAELSTGEKLGLGLSFQREAGRAQEPEHGGGDDGYTMDATSVRMACLSRAVDLLANIAAQPEYKRQVTLETAAQFAAFVLGEPSA